MDRGAWLAAVHGVAKELVGRDLATQRQQTSKSYMYQFQTPCSSHPTPFPLDIHMFVLYVYVSVSALHEIQEILLGSGGAATWDRLESEWVSRLSSEMGQLRPGPIRVWILQGRAWGRGPCLGLTNHSWDPRNARGLSGRRWRGREEDG